MKSLLLIITAFCIYNNTLSQNPQYYVHDANRINPIYGSAKELRGKTHIINVFVSDDKRGWRKSDKELELAQEAEGLGWIQWHKKDWGITDISVTLSSIGMEEDIKVGKIERTEDITKLKSITVPIVMQAAGYMNIPAFYDSVKIATQADNILLIIFAKKASRSYALHCNSNNKMNEKFLEGAVVFKESYYEQPTSAAVIIHEMLHLFGARDLYHDKQIKRDPEIENKMTTVFPNSIMLEGSNDIAALKVDQFTAWCIGWTHSYWGWYSYFLPQTKTP